MTITTIQRWGRCPIVKHSMAFGEFLWAWLDASELCLVT